MKRRGGSLIISLIGLGVGMIVLLTSIAYASFANPIRLVKGTGAAASSDGIGNGCYLADQYFTDTALSATPDQTIATLSSQYPNAGKVTSYIKEILTKSQQEGVNPAIILGIWQGEQGFTHPEKAFGFQYYDSGASSGAKSGSAQDQWEFQLNGVFKPIKSAVNNTGYYTKPEGTNMMTRLFYNYATAMQKQYKESGNAWLESYNDSNNGNPYYTRLNVIKLLVPNEVVCSSSTATTSTPSTPAPSNNSGTPTSFNIPHTLPVERRS